MTYKLHTHVITVTQSAVYFIKEYDCHGQSQSHEKEGYAGFHSQKLLNFWETNSLPTDPEQPEQTSDLCIKTYLDQLPRFATFKLYRFYSITARELVKIHLTA